MDTISLVFFVGLVSICYILPAIFVSLYLWDIVVDWVGGNMSVTLLQAVLSPILMFLAIAAVLLPIVNMVVITMMTMDGELPRLILKMNEIEIWRKNDSE